LKYVLADNPKRIFINPTLGCLARCSYCYLPHIGLGFDSIESRYSAEQLIEYVVSNKNYIPGKTGSIISIGCYTESWYDFNKKATQDIIKYFTKTDNPVQLASKRVIDVSDLRSIANHISWDGQVSVYTSCSTISHWQRFERNTIPPYERFINFKLRTLEGLGSYLYIKPVIKGITIQDVAAFSKIIHENSIDVVVGSMFVLDESGQRKIAPIGGGILACSETEEEDVMIDKLSNFCRVYRNSTDVFSDERVIIYECR